MEHLARPPETFVAPRFLDDVEEAPISAVATFVATIAVIIAFFASVWAWCYFVCRGYGGLRSCEVGWFEAKAVCNN